MSLVLKVAKAALALQIFILAIPPYNFVAWPIKLFVAPGHALATFNNGLYFTTATNGTGQAFLSVSKLMISGFGAYARGIK